MLFHSNHKSDPKPVKRLYNPTLEITDILHQAMVIEASCFSDQWTQLPGPSLELLPVLLPYLCAGSFTLAPDFCLCPAVYPSGLWKMTQWTIIFSHNSICVLLANTSGWMHPSAHAVCLSAYVGHILKFGLTSRILWQDLLLGLHFHSFFYEP